MIDWDKLLSVAGAALLIGAIAWALKWAVEPVVDIAEFIGLFAIIAETFSG